MPADCEDFNAQSEDLDGRFGYGSDTYGRLADDMEVYSLLGGKRHVVAGRAIGR